MQVIYIAGPFRASTQWVVKNNVQRAERWGLEVARAGHMPLIQHTNTANFHGLGSDDFWIKGTTELLRRCDGIIAIPLSKDSSGTRGELAEARRRGLVVLDLSGLDIAPHEAADAIRDAFGPGMKGHP